MRHEYGVFNPRGPALGGDVVSRREPPSPWCDSAAPRTVGEVRAVGPAWRCPRQTDRPD